jgi:hypothetical protein
LLAIRHALKELLKKFSIEEGNNKRRKLGLLRKRQDQNKQKYDSVL